MRVHSPTRREPSQPVPDQLLGAATLHPVSYTVLVRIDEVGRWPVVVQEDERLFSDDGARWRFVAAVGTWAEAQR
jgi:hypothetical protein